MEQVHSSWEDLTELQARFRNEVPAISEPYVRRVAPQHLPLTRKYNEARRVAASHQDIDKCVELKERLVALVKP